jgi:hypothetical protein
MSVYDGPKISTNGLVLALDAGNRFSYVSGSTTWNDISNNNNNGTLTNGPTFSSANGGSIVFDGVDDYCILNSSIIPQTSNWTYSSFFNINALATGSVLLGQYIPAVGNGRIIIRLSDDTGNLHKLSLFLGSGPTYSSVNVNSTIIPTLNTTYNFTVSRNSQTYDLYINGILNTTYTAAFTASILQTTPIIGGRTNDGGGSPTPVNADFLNGRIYTTQIYNRALSSQEILQNYNTTKTRFGL